MSRHTDAFQTDEHFPYNIQTPAESHVHRDSHQMAEQRLATRHSNHYPGRSSPIASPSAQNRVSIAGNSNMLDALPSPGPRDEKCTLWLGDLEPWMDESYVIQVCNLMGWQNVIVEVPRHTTSDTPGQHPNNPGYCLITFSSTAQAAQVLADTMPSSPSASPLILPNSARPFKMDYASSPNAVHAMQSAAAQTPEILQPIEYSIFVGDLAPEATNADLVAVFQDPRLGLRSDRVPRHIAPFKSCQSAKIMVDSTTHLSRGFGFVRFTDPADQRRALVEMQGLYCLSRPMRISAATARQKAPITPISSVSDSKAVNTRGLGLASPLINQFHLSPTYDGSLMNQGISSEQRSTPQLERNASRIQPGRSITAPIANGTASVSQLTGSTPQEGGLENSPLSPAVLAQIAQLAIAAASRNVPPTPLPFTRQEDFQKWLQENSRALLNTVAAANGDQTSVNDPYNTTVFVGGLSPLISEQTLRSFFDPFGPIHYVKVPPGKNCGFVQFVNKADAEYAIQSMHGFPIAGSKIRLSWGRSHCKAAQAAQAPIAQHGAPPYSPGNFPNLTPEKLQLLLQSLGYFGNNPRPAARDFNGASRDHNQYIQPPNMPDHPYGFRNSYSPIDHAIPMENGSETYHDGYSRANDIYSRPQVRQPYNQGNAIFSPFSGDSRRQSPLTSLSPGRERLPYGVGEVSSGYDHMGFPYGATLNDNDLHDINGTLASLSLDQKPSFYQNPYRPDVTRGPIYPMPTNGHNCG